MLSLRAQGMATSLTMGSLRQSSFNGSRSLSINASHPFMTPDQNCAASISSQSSRSQAPSPKPQTLAVSALKGLFSGVTRSRSPSQSMSIDEGSEPETNEDSFGNMGHNLLSMGRPNTTSDVPPPSPLPSLMQPYQAPSSPEFSKTGFLSEKRLDRRIVIQHQPGSWPIKDLSAKSSRTLSVGSLSLHPAPRRRPWTIGTPGPAAEQPTASSESNENDSTVVDDLSNFEQLSIPNFSGFSFGTPEQKNRALSLRSVSTFASGDNGSNAERSNSSTKAKRWSRQGSLPKRLTPPSGPPPAIPQAQSSRMPNTHPYLSEGGTSCQSSTSIPSANSQISIVSGLPTFSKRGSNSSGQSANSSQSHSIGHSVARTIPPHRGTVPPPRPAPTFAPPPAPDHESFSRPSESSGTSRNTSFRDSFPHRTFRLSLTAPKPPPLTTLPPRPDEPEYYSRVSSSTNTPSADLYPIPASPVPSVSSLPPSTHSIPPIPSSSTPASRNSSLKQRLRILSAPSSSSIPPVPEGYIINSRYPIYRQLPQPYTPPSTPIGERITQYQNDPGFLQSSQSPITPTLCDSKAVRRLPCPPDENLIFPELTSLSPPPRRGSRQLSVDKTADDMQSTLEVKTSVAPGDDKLISLSRHGSVISLGIVSM